MSNKLPIPRTSGPYVLGWSLERSQRAELLLRFPPAYANVVADHVTLWAHVGKGEPLPPGKAGEIVGRVDDGAGVEALVVRIEGSTGRPDGITFHITWSLGEGRRAVESNHVLKARGWQALPVPIPITLKPWRVP